MNLKRIKKIETSIKQQVQLESEVFWANFTKEELETLLDGSCNAGEQEVATKFGTLHGRAICDHERWLMNCQEYKEMELISRAIKARFRAKKCRKA